MNDEESAIAVIIVGDGAFDTYSTIESARRWLEAEDVSDGLYEAFDQCGQPMELTVSNGLVLILPFDGEVEDASRFERLVREQVKLIRPGQLGVPDPDEASLAEMLSALHTRPFRRRHGTRKAI